MYASICKELSPLYLYVHAYGSSPCMYTSRAQAAAITTLVICFTTRSILLMVLPTLEAQIEW